jgi:RNA polymerase sigma factor (TIGR02999 family)
MPDVTRLLDAAHRGDAQAAADLLPLVYDELRKLATAKLNHEQPGQTLEATALVHEAYLRLVGNQTFDNRHHFLAAAAQAMRRILVESARQKRRLKRGGGRERTAIELDALTVEEPDDELLALHDALDRFAVQEPRRAKLVELRFFGGMTLPEIAEHLSVSLSTAERDWRYARAWLYAAMGDGEMPAPE